MDDVMTSKSRLPATVERTTGRSVARDKRPVLVILHQEHSTSGHIGHQIVASGRTLDVRRPRFGDELPQTLAGHAGTVIFGGPMSANDDEDYIHTERVLIGLALKEEQPLLGVCLGGQLLALELGAKVWSDAEGRVEIGYHPVHAVGPAGRWGGAWPTHFYQWHREGFELPKGAELLAKADGTFDVQAFKYGRAAFAIQFHPEITYQMVSRWSRNEAKLQAPGAWPRSQQLADHFTYSPSVLDWLGRFISDWLASGDGGKLPQPSRVCDSATVQV